jgi:hypothetical protein
MTESGGIDMTVATPNEPVYYYECSNGQFRLFYCLPAVELKRLRRANQISAQVVKDYPDGVDLGCTEVDFVAFDTAYGYRPKTHPDVLRQAFFAIYSSTYNWKKFRGSGFIPAADLEQQVGTIETELRKKVSEPTILRATVKKPSLAQRRKSKREQAVQQKRTIDTLKQFQVKGIDPKLTMAKQEFRPIDTIKGEDAEKVFTKLLQKQQKGR